MNCNGEIRTNIPVNDCNHRPCEERAEPTICSKVRVINERTTDIKSLVEKIHSRLFDDDRVRTNEPKGIDYNADLTLERALTFAEKTTDETLAMLCNIIERL